MLKCSNLSEHVIFFDRIASTEIDGDAVRQTFRACYDVRVSSFTVEGA